MPEDHTPCHPYTSLLAAGVGPGCPNARADVIVVQHLLNGCRELGRLPPDLEKLCPDGRFGPATAGAIRVLQRSLPAASELAGCVEPGGQTLTTLGEMLPQLPDALRLAVLFPRAPQAALDELGLPLLRVMAGRDIASPRRQAHFLAQIGHESGELRYREELADGRAYEGRKALGNLRPGDGPRFKGRGMIQLTGRANYAAYGRSLDREAELLAHPERVAEDPWLTVDAAGWFWAVKHLNALADAEDLEGVTRRINGGLNGLADRRRLLHRARMVLGERIMAAGTAAETR